MAPKKSVKGAVPSVAADIPSLVQFYGSERRISADIIKLIGNFNPRYVGTDIRLMMRLDPMIAFGLAVLRAPIVNLEWSVESRDPVIKAFVEHVFHKIYRNMATALSMAIPFGRQLCDVVMKADSLDLEYSDPVMGTAQAKSFPVAWMPTRFKAIDPRTYHFILDPDQDDWTGVQQLFMRPGQENEVVPRERVVLWSFRREEVFGRLEGFPMLDQAYEPWWFSTATQLIANRYFERKADPALKVRAAEKILQGGKEVDGYRYAAQQALALKSGGAIVLPSARDPKDPKSYLFDIEFLQDDKRGDQLQHRLDSLDVQKLHALWITDRAGTSGGGGTKGTRGGLAESKQHGAVLSESQESIIDEMVDDVLQPQVVDRIVQQNFGDEALKTSRTRLTTAGISDTQQTIYQDLLDNLFKAEMAMLSGEEIALKDRIDQPAMLKALQIPQRPEDELEELIQERKVRAQERMDQMTAMGQAGGGDPNLQDPKTQASVRNKLKKNGVQQGAGDKTALDRGVNHGLRRRMIAKALDLNPDAGHLGEIVGSKT